MTIFDYVTTGSIVLAGNMRIRLAVGGAAGIDPIPAGAAAYRWAEWINWGLTPQHRP